MTKIKLYLIGALAVALATAMWQWRAEIRNAAQYALGVQQLEQAVADQRDALERSRARIAAEHEARSALLDELAAIRERQRRLDREFRELELRDDEVADWADQPLPSALIDGVRE